MVLIHEKIEFSASHLYHNPNFSARRSPQLPESATMPHGHRHNYTLEVMLP